jgi:Transposase DDE domain
MAKKAYRVRNWRKYNEALVNRGSINFWFSEEMINNWHINDSLKTRGRPKKYSDMAITCGLTLKAVFKLSFRAVEGFIKSLVDRLKIKAEVPDYSLLCKRQKTLKVSFAKKSLKPGESIHILVDSTGLKIFGEGEWKVRQHGYVKRREWRKLHLAVNANNQEIEAFQLTELDVQDGKTLPKLLNEIDKKIDGVTGDGAFDQYKIYKLSEERNFKLIVPPKRDAKLTKECTGFSTRKKHTPEMLHALKNRDCVIEKIRQIGRTKWKQESGYHRRSLVETSMFRIKTLLGTRLSTRKFEHQQVEAAIWCNVINQMTNLGMPLSVAVS